METNPHHVAQQAAIQKIQADKQRISSLDDTLSSWKECYLELMIRPIRDDNITAKITLHLTRFHTFYFERYGHDTLSLCLKGDIVTWLTYLSEDLVMAPATVNNHLASVSGWFNWIFEQDPHRFVAGNPCRGVSQLPLPPLEPRALTKLQITSLKNLCDRLPQLHEKKGKRYQARMRKGSTPPETHGHARPWRDRAVVYFLLATGARREELVMLNLSQVHPNTPAELRSAQIAKISSVHGKGKTRRNLYLSADARAALADYLERERPTDAEAYPEASALFLRASSIRLSVTASLEEHRGRFAVRQINRILEQIGEWHDAEYSDLTQHISPLRPHDLRHTFGFLLSQATGADEFELERRLGHRNRRYIGLYTNPPEQEAAKYIENF